MKFDPQSFENQIVALTRDGRRVQFDSSDRTNSLFPLLGRIEGDVFPTSYRIDGGHTGLPYIRSNCDLVEMVAQ